MLEWVVPALFVFCGLVAVGFIGWRNTKRQITRTLERRPNLGREAFLQEMGGEVSREASEFLWEAAVRELSYIDTALTPHPDDDLARDLPIDDDDWSLDWPREWAERKGFHESNFPDWPEGSPATVRNFAKWLDMAPV